MNPQKSGHLAGMTFAIVFGLTFMFSKTALSHITPIGLIAYRFLTAFVMFEILRRFAVIKVRFDKKLWKALLPVVLFQPILYFLFETYGLERTTSSEAGMMIALIPIFVTVLSALILKERPRKIQVFFILLSVSGIFVIRIMETRGAFEPETLGFLLLLGAVLSAAFFNIASRSASRLLKAQETTYFMMLFGAVAFNALYLAQLMFGEGLGAYFGSLSTLELVVPILYLGVVASIGGFFLLNFALARLQAHVISIYANLATIVAIAAGAVILNESLYSYHYIGAAMIITGVYGTIRTNRKVKRSGLSRHEYRST